MNATPSDPAAPSATDGQAAPVAHVEAKAALLLVLLATLLALSTAYLLYARGWFESSQTVVLLADDSEGVTVGMDMTFSGFPIGRVRRIELAPDGNARILVDVPRRDAHWLRESSVFTMERSLVGSTRIRAYSGILSDPPLPDGAQRSVLKGDAMADVPRLMIAVRDLLDNLNRMTDEPSPLNTSLRHVATLTERLQGPQGALGLVMGNAPDRQRVLQLLQDSRQLVQQLEQLAGQTRGLVTHTDERLYGDQGLLRDVQASVRELQGLLQGARSSLQRVDGVLVEAQGIAANTRAATVDLVALRAEVESSLRQVDLLVNEVQRKWPFARDTEVRLP